MTRYIDADKLIDDIRPFAEYDSNRSNKDWVRRFEIAIDAQPTADVREDVKGKWIIKTDGFVIKRVWGVCSECGNTLDFSGVNAGRGDANFCPNCGADMRGDQT